MRTRVRVAPFAVKEITGEGEFSGYGAVFGNRDAYGDVIERGAFAATLAAHAAAGTTPAMLWQHRPGEPIGVWKSLREDDHGLFVEGALALKTARGAEAHELLRMGALRGLSIGYDVPPGGAEFDRAANVTRLRAIDLWETSIVTFPANPQATVESVKAALASPRDFERILRDAGFSRTLAKRLMAGGYDAVRDLRDAECEEPIDDVKAALRNLTTQIARAARGE